MSGVVYFIQSSLPARPIKIGFTKGSVEIRLKALQTGHPAKLTLLGCFRGGQAEETGLHREFAEARIHGEWFEPIQSLCERIQQLKEVIEEKSSLSERLNDKPNSIKNKPDDPFNFEIDGEIGEHGLPAVYIKEFKFIPEINRIYMYVSARYHAVTNRFDRVPSDPRLRLTNLKHKSLCRALRTTRVSKQTIELVSSIHHALDEIVSQERVQ